MASTCHVISFNILSSVMSNTKYFKDSPYLDFKNRSKVLESQFVDLIKDRPIIGFQEWGLAESAAFNQFFTENNYFIFATYGGLEERDRFATAIAIPLDKYEIVKLGFKKTADYIPEPPKNIVLDGPPIVKGRDLPENCYIFAKQQHNEVSYAILKDENQKQFIFFNYHAPCIFWWLPVMILHGDALRRVIDDISEQFEKKITEDGNSEELPIIVVGDFNIEYGRSLYGLMIDEYSGEEVPYQEWKPSEYKRKLKDTKKDYTEDSCTTINTSPNGKVFKEVLDYIFVSNFYVIDTKVYISTDSPNKINGSDHFPIEATLSFKDHVEYFVSINNDYRSGPSLKIKTSEMRDCDFSFLAYHDGGKTVEFYDILSSSAILSIPYENNGDKLMKQIYTKINGHLPFVVTGATSSYKDEGYYPKIENFLDDAPKEILECKEIEDWCFCVVLDGSKIEGSLIIKPRS